MCLPCEVAIFSLSGDEGICIEFHDVVNTLDLHERGSKVGHKMHGVQKT